MDHNDLLISGSMSTAGGTFGQVKISGHATVKGDLQCNDFKVNGNADVSGGVRATDAVIRGNFMADGDFRASSLQLHGHADIKGDCHADRILLRGMTKIGKSLTGEEMEIKGTVHVKENCEAEVFNIQGSFEIGGLLNAGKIDITLFGGAKVKEIGGETITVNRETITSKIARLIKSLFSFSMNHTLTADVIEGDDIRLEYTTASVVRGNHVKIGPGCEIGLVEYKNSLDVSPEATVKERKKI
ncbi:polymer-forming cytoskeletal protein [Staphylospora marina]|uniref:polymer-forming cytoskeletal protein n=1 Tax=Staphylospora marina TaxID=2490858 RepID=UPI000F5BA949|nr:polymer-forming cytoskeletal protein [Staphylospora marina]